MNSREDLLKAQITQSQKEIETNEKVAKAYKDFESAFNDMKKDLNIVANNQIKLNENLQAYTEEIKQATEQAKSFNENVESKFNNYLTQMKNTTTSINETLHQEIKNNFDIFAKDFKDTIKQSIIAIKECTEQANKTIEDNAKAYKSFLLDSKEQVKRETKNISSQHRTSIIVNYVFLVLILLYCIQWQFNCIPFLSKAPTDDFLSGVLVALFGIVIIIFLVVFIAKKLQDR